MKARCLTSGQSLLECVLSMQLFVSTQNDVTIPTLDNGDIFNYLTVWLNGVTSSCHICARGLHAQTTIFRIHEDPPALQWMWSGLHTPQRSFRHFKGGHQDHEEWWTTVPVNLHHTAGDKVKVINYAEWGLQVQSSKPALSPVAGAQVVEWVVGGFIPGFP